MFTGFTRYCNSTRVSFLKRPSDEFIGGHCIAWNRVVFDSEPIEYIDLHRLCALVREFDEYKPGSGCAVPFGHDDIKNELVVEHIRLYIQYETAAISFPFSESEMDDDIDIMRKRILDSITWHMCH